MSRVDEPRRKSPAALPRCLVMLAIVFAAGQRHPASAQQWTTSGNNISNTNSGNVGVGTNTPSAALHVANGASSTPAVKINGAAGQTANLLEFRMSDNTLRSYINSAGALIFNPAMDQVSSAVAIAPNFNNAYYASAEHNAFTIDGANMSHYGLYTNPTVRMFLIKDVNGLNAVEVNKIGMTTFRGDMSNRSWVANINVDSTNAYYAGDADGLLINGTGLSSHGLYTGGTVRLLRVIGTGEALAVTRENLTGFGTLTPGARVEIVGTGNTAATGALSVKNSSSNSLLFVRDSGHVGVGTTAPAAKLHVTGDARVEGAGGRIYLGSQAVQNYRGLEIIEENSTTFSIRHHDPSVAWRNIVLNPHGGNVGVGTLSPGYRFDVQGGQLNASGGLCIAGDCKTSWSQVGGGTGSQWTTSGSNVYYNSGNVGVGTATPNGRFEVAGGPIFLGDMGNAGWGNMLIRGRVLSANSNIHLSPPGGSSIYIDSNYRDAGGLAGPVNLFVSGDVNSSGTITGNNIVAKYQDVAEWVPSTQKLSAGTVVVLDPERSNHVLASAAAYDTRVAGVVSARPGVILGEAGEGRLMVATTGRVRVRVDATRGPIRVGDLLVTGEAPGAAMRSEPVEVGGVRMHRPGTIIGKALEPLEKGVGDILVLLSLQ